MGGSEAVYPYGGGNARRDLRIGEIMVSRHVFLLLAARGGGDRGVTDVFDDVPDV